MFSLLNLRLSLNKMSLPEGLDPKERHLFLSVPKILKDYLCRANSESDEHRFPCIYH